MHNFSYEVSKDGDKVMIFLRGRIEHENAAELEEIICQQFEDGATDVCVDLYNTEFLPSICFGVLLMAGDKANDMETKFSAIMKPHHANLAKGIGVEQVFTLIEKE